MKLSSIPQIYRHLGRWYEILSVLSKYELAAWIGRLGPDFETVNQGMQMQSQGAGQIAESMTHLRDAAQQTRESLGEFSSVAGQLHEAVDVLMTEVGRFSAADG